MYALLLYYSRCCVAAQAEKERKDAISTAKFEAAMRKQNERLQLFAQGKLCIQDLTHAELITQLRPLGLKCNGSRLELADRLRDAKRKAAELVEGEAEGQEEANTAIREVQQGEEPAAKKMKLGEATTASDSLPDSVKALCTC